MKEDEVEARSATVSDGRDNVRVMLLYDVDADSVSIAVPSVCGQSAVDMKNIMNEWKRSSYGIFI